MTSRRRRRGPGLTGEDWWSAFELRWPRPTYRILAQPEGPWGAALAAIPERHIPFLDGTPPEPWRFVRREVPQRGSRLFPDVPPPFGPSAAETVHVYKLGWPAGGIFVPQDESAPAPLYEPLTVASDILLAAQAVAPEDARSVLGFVNRWGRLGVGIPGAEDFRTDGVTRTGECLRDLSQWMAALYALQRGQPVRATWPDLAAVFREQLAHVHVGARPTSRGLVPMFPLRRLLDALYLELWGLATDAKRLRQCPRCKYFFIRGREDQIFCTGRCARLWHVKRWKQRVRQKRRARRHQREVS